MGGIRRIVVSEIDGFWCWLDIVKFNYVGVMYTYTMVAETIGASMIEFVEEWTAVMSEPAFLALVAGALVVYLIEEKFSRIRGEPNNIDLVAFGIVDRVCEYFRFVVREGGAKGSWDRPEGKFE